MSTESKDLDQNALAARLTSTWTNFKQGKLISYKMMALLLLVTAALGLWLYISWERQKANSRRWLEFDEATTAERLNELAQRYPDTPLAAYALLNIARAQLGVEGLDVLNGGQLEKRAAAVENIEKARKAYGELLPRFQSDPVGRAECYLALAKAEMALVAIPEKPDDLTRFKGELSRAVEYLDELLKLLPPESPLAKDARRHADALRNEQAPDPKDRLAAEEFKRIQRALYELKSPFLGLPSTPGGPRAPDTVPPVGGIPGSSSPVSSRPPAGN